MPKALNEAAAGDGGFVTCAVAAAVGDGCYMRAARS